jgi:arsenite methyltransferase
MTEYLQYTFTDSPEFVSTFDEMPLWSASFGLLLLKHLQLKPNLTVLDIGSGAGFPLLELAQRLGTSCKCYGIDTWTNANNRAKQKAKNYEVANVTIIEGSAERVPLGNASIDLIVSNLGINNFEHPEKVFKECERLLKRGGKLAITTNLNGHWKEFYNIFEDTLCELGQPDLIMKLKKEEEHRGTVKSISSMFTNNGFVITRHFEEQMEMKFVNGSAFLNHYFVKLGWLSSWTAIIPETDRVPIFTRLEENLNRYADKMGGLTLTVPMAFIEGETMQTV